MSRSCRSCSSLKANDIFESVSSSRKEPRGQGPHVLTAEPSGAPAVRTVVTVKARCQGHGFQRNSDGFPGSTWPSRPLPEDSSRLRFGEATAASRLTHVRRTALALANGACGGRGARAEITLRPATSGLEALTSPCRLGACPGRRDFRVLPELRSSKPGYRDSMRQVWLRFEGCSGYCAQVQGHDADDERAAGRGAAPRRTARGSAGGTSCRYARAGHRRPIDTRSARDSRSDPAEA